MEYTESMELSRPNTETITGPAGSSLSYSPERGGIITSLKLRDTEILYLDEKTFCDRSGSVRGGIPILFPNAGPINHERYLGLKQHGFGRTSDRWQAMQDPTGQGFYESLVANDETRAVYPFDFLCALRGQLEEDGSITITQEVVNREAGQDLPIAMGLHPYFKVPAGAKSSISFDFAGGKDVEESVNAWANGSAISIANPALVEPEAVMRVRIPSLGTLVMRVSPEYKRIWIWSLPDKDFVCIEPFMRDAGGLVDDPKLVKPGTAYTANINLRLE